MLPKGYYPEDVEEEAEVPARPRTGPTLWRRALPAAVAVAALAGFSGLLLITYFSSGHSGDGPPPLIQADSRPVKVRPESPGGTEVPNQDIRILEDVGNGPRAPAREFERLLPPPEAPLPRPTTAPPVLQPEIPAAPNVTPPPDAIVVQKQPQAQLPTVTAQAPARPQPPPQPEAAAPRKLTLPPALLQGQPAAAPAAAPAPAGQIVLRPPGGRAVAEPAPPPETSGVVSAELPGFRIQLGVKRSEDEAEREWQRLRENHGDLIGRLSAAMVRSGSGRSATYRIQAGPLLTQTGAAAVCRRLAARGVGCFVVKR